MMFNSFTSFDMSTTMNSLMAISTLALMTIMLMTPKKKHFPMYTMKKMSLLYMGNLLMMQMTNPSSGKLIKGFHMYMFSVYILIGPLNLMGLIPWMFTPTSHLMFTLSLAAPLWLSMILTSITSYPKTSLAHYLPENTMPLLAPFLANIEQLSSTIRPITLSFRMSANISAGHVILALMGAFASHLAIFHLSLTLLSIIFIAIMYLMFEVMVCMAQTYVFTLLSTMYTNDYIHLPKSLTA